MEFVSRSEAGIRGVWLSATENPAPKAPWESALRRGSLLPLLVLVGVLTDNIADFSLAAIGALNIGLIDSAVPRRTLFAALGSTAVLMTILAFVTALLAGHWLVLVILVPVAFIAGVLSSCGFAVSSAGFFSLLSVIVFTNDPRNFSGAVWLAVWVCIGALLQVVSAMIAWRYEREAAIRRALGVLVDQVRKLALGGDVTPKSLHSAASAELAAEVALRDARLPQGPHERYTAVMAELNWTRLTLVEWLSSTVRTTDDRQAVAAVLEHVDSDVRRVVHPLRDSWPPVLDRAPDQSSESLFAQLRSLDEAARRFADPVAGPTTKGDSKTFSIASRAGAGRRLGEDWESARALFKPSSRTFGHGVRLAIAIAVAEIVVLAFHIDRGYWVALTVAVVLRADVGSTVTRGVLRIVGTVISVTVVGLLMYFAGNPAWLIVVLLAVFAPLTMRWFTGNYALSALGITTTVLLLVESGTLSLDVVELRLVNTLLGGAIAFVGFLVWPAWGSDQVTDLLKKALITQKSWSEAVLAAFGQDQTLDSDTLRDLGRASRNAVIAARPAAVASLIEPHRVGVDPQAALQIVDACSEAGIATMALEVTLRSRATSAHAAAALDTGPVSVRVAADFNHAAARVAPTEANELIANATPARVGMSRAKVPPSGDQVVDRALMLLISASDSVAAASASAG